eukprot:6338499-Ditylum_brightwellii.AAC.1
MKPLPKRCTNISNLEQMEEAEELKSTSEARGNAEKTSNLNHNPQELDSNTRMESSRMKKGKPKIH